MVGKHSEQRQVTGHRTPQMARREMEEETQNVNREGVKVGNR